MKKKTLLTLAVIIPVVMIVITALGVLQVTKNIVPQQPFLYAVSTDGINAALYYCQEQVRQVILPKAAHMPKRMAPNIPLYHPPCPPVKFFVYDFKTASNHAVTLAQAQHLALGNTTISNDGYSIGSYCMGKIFPFTSRSSIQEYYSNFCLSKGGYRRQFNPRPLADTERNYYMTFITWLAGENK